MSVLQSYLSVNDKCRDAAAYLLSKFMTRQDVKVELLPESLDWMMKSLKESSGTNDCDFHTDYLKEKTLSLHFHKVNVVINHFSISYLSYEK